MPRLTQDGVGVPEPRRRRRDAAERLQRLGLLPLPERDVGDGEERERAGLQIRLRGDLPPLADGARRVPVPQQRPAERQARPGRGGRVRVVAERRPQDGRRAVRVVPPRGALGDQEERAFAQLRQDPGPEERLALAPGGGRVVLAEREQTEPIGRPLGDGLLAAPVPELPEVVLRLEEPALLLERPPRGDSARSPGSAARAAGAGSPGRCRSPRRGRRASWRRPR